MADRTRATDLKVDRGVGENSGGKGRLRGIPVGVRNRLAYLRWRLRHPFSNFQQYYIDQAERRLDAGQAHATLGTERKDAQGFVETAGLIMGFLSEQGLTPSDRVVDYGCGSLRIGRELMQFLEPGHYFGMDITDRFYSDGLRDIPDAVVERARPTLRVISDESVAEIHDAQVDWVFSSGVLIHVPPAEMDGFFDRLWALSRPGTRFVVRFRSAEQVVRHSAVSWYYPPDDVVAYLQARGAAAEAVRVDDTVDVDDGDSVNFPAYYLLGRRPA